MKYYSTNHNVPEVTLKEAVIQGLAADNGLFMPESIARFDAAFFDNIQNLSFREIAFEVAKKFFGNNVEDSRLRDIVFDTLAFDCPVVKLEENIFSLELFHGPTLAFKDVGARFMARLLNHFLGKKDKIVNVLVATSGDTGSAVANGFLGVDGIHVYVLYPSGKVSAIQESQFTTLGKNITALEIEGTFDDCQRLVKLAFLDRELNKTLNLTSANSINIARFLPQSFYYFNAFARLKEQGVLDNKELVFSVPSGNLGNITAGLVAHKMGLPVKYFIAANNANNVVFDYLNNGNYEARASVETIANAMDVGAPSNFVRILDLYGHSHERIAETIKGAWYSNDEIKQIIKKVYKNTGYICDPHGACGFQALKDNLREAETGVFLETAHPAKFMETMEQVVGKGTVKLPEKLAAFMKGKKSRHLLSSGFEDFKNFLLNGNR
ncbi:MAG: threonine synthase [Draconibacterium sp.]|nr:MAG: threonine synthase [Draconibacterium sp.]